MASVLLEMHPAVERYNGKVFEDGAGYTKAPMPTQNAKMIPVRRPPKAPLNQKGR